jgi:hypothetical protein
MLPPDNPQEELEKIANTMFAAYGVRGVRLTMGLGKKTWCGALKTGGIQINIDPDEIAHGKELTPEAMMAAVSHELGHAKDMLENPAKAYVKLSKTDCFFYNLLDDTVIDSRLRRFPRLEQPVADLYHEVMNNQITDLTQTPLSNQLMYGMRIGRVLGQQPAVDERVKNMLDSLRNYTTPNRDAVDVVDILTLGNTSLAERRAIADSVIKPLYDELVEQDRQDGRDNDINELIDMYEQSHGNHGDDDSEDTDDSKSNQTEQSRKSLPEQIKDAIEQSAKDGGEISEDEADNEAGENKASDADQNSKNDSTASENSDSQHNEQQDTETPADIAGSLAAEMQLPLPDAEKYLYMVIKHQAIIRSTAEVFKQLAHLTKGTRRLTNARGRSLDGTLLHVDSIADLALQESAGLPARQIWQQTKRRATRETVDFGGLDIHLLIDASGSMRHNHRAVDATATAVCLIEGLKLAKMQIAKANKCQMPDVRTHVVAFGSSAVEVSPLAYQISQPELGQMYSTLINPNAGATLINDALISCNGTPPERDSIIFIVSDGGIFDDHIAAQTIQCQSPGAYVGQFIIGNNQGVAKLTENAEELSDSRLLPEKLLAVLRNHTMRYLP